MFNASILIYAGSEIARENGLLPMPPEIYPKPQETVSQEAEIGLRPLTAPKHIAFFTFLEELLTNFPYLLQYFHALDKGWHKDRLTAHGSRLILYFNRIKECQVPNR